MMPSRNSILITGLALFLVWYVSNWAYKSLYLEPRQKLNTEIQTLSAQITAGKGNRDAMNQFNTQYAWLYSRTLPQIPNDAHTQYTFWLLELVQYCEFENHHVEPTTPTRVPAGWSYQFTARGTGTLPQLTQFLLEFYCAPFLHRITSLTLKPVDGNPEKLECYITVNALALPKHLTRQLPSGWHYSRLTYDLPAYQIISNRNLLETARGGIDKADFTELTGIMGIGDKTEVWFSVRTDGTTIKAKLGEIIHSGSFFGKLVEILDRDIVLLDHNGERWLLTMGEFLTDAFALPPETGEIMTESIIEEIEEETDEEIVEEMTEETEEESIEKSEEETVEEITEEAGEETDEESIEEEEENNE